MSARTAERMRAWKGPALLFFGFRPFFLGGSLWAAGAMALWTFMLTGQITLPTRFDPVSWHAHELLFGTTFAIIAGYLLTSVPNWTGRLPVTGWGLGALGLVWIAGRISVAFSAGLPWGISAAVDLAFPVILGAALLREVLAGRNLKNIGILGILTVLTLANAWFYIDAVQGRVAAQGSGLRLGLAAVIMMIALIGGRLVPSFTRNWLAITGDPARPTPPMRRFDKAVLAMMLAALGLWVIWPLSDITGAALLGVSALHFLRLARWKGWRTYREPLVLVLHAGYAFVPLGALAVGLQIFLGADYGADAAQHVWMAGAIGLMTLAVMTRTTLGHTGRALKAGRGTVAIYGLVIVSVALRIVAPLWPEWPLLEGAALFWIAAFGGFALLYGPLLMRAKPAKS